MPYSRRQRLLLIDAHVSVPHVRKVSHGGGENTIRPAYILGGRGTGIAYSVEEFEKLAASGIEASPINEILVEE